MDTKAKLKLLFKIIERALKPKIQKLFEDKIYFKQGTKINFIPEELIKHHLYAFTESLYSIYDSFYSHSHGKKTAGDFIDLFFEKRPSTTARIGEVLKNIKNPKEAAFIKEYQPNFKILSLFISEHVLLLENMFFYSGYIQSKDVEWIKSESLLFKRYYGRKFIGEAHKSFKKDVTRAIKGRNYSIADFLTSYDGGWVKYPIITKLDAKYIKTLKPKDEKRKHLANKIDLYTYILTGFYGVIKKRQLHSIITKKGLLTLPEHLYKELESRALRLNKTTKDFFKQVDNGKIVIERIYTKLNPTTIDIIKMAGKSNGKYIQKRYSKGEGDFKEKLYRKSLEENLESLIPKYNKEKSNIISDCHQARIFINQDYSTKIPTPVSLDPYEVRLLMQYAQVGGLEIKKEQKAHILKQKAVYNRLKSLIKKIKKV